MGDAAAESVAVAHCEWKEEAVTSEVRVLPPPLLRVTAGDPVCLGEADSVLVKEGEGVAEAETHPLGDARGLPEAAAVSVARGDAECGKDAVGD